MPGVMLTPKNGVGLSRLLRPAVRWTPKFPPHFRAVLYPADSPICGGYLTPETVWISCFQCGEVMDILLRQVLTSLWKAPRRKISVGELQMCFVCLKLTSTLPQGKGQALSLCHVRVGSQGGPGFPARRQHVHDSIRPSLLRCARPKKWASSWGGAEWSQPPPFRDPVKSCGILLCVSWCAHGHTNF